MLSESSFVLTICIRALEEVLAQRGDAFRGAALRASALVISVEKVFTWAKNSKKDSCQKEQRGLNDRRRSMRRAGPRR